jgi:hypothetical protein
MYSAATPINSLQSILQICEWGLHIQSVYIAYAITVSVLLCSSYNNFYSKINLSLQFVKICLELIICTKICHPEDVHHLYVSYKMFNWISQLIWTLKFV